MSEQIKIIVATHKEYEMPTDSMYLPLHVGAKGKIDDGGKTIDFGYMKDDQGDNISEFNPYFGTQTGLYWMWKNLDAEYKGLVHYRRYFIGNSHKKGKMLDSVLKKEEIIPYLKNYRVFVPKKRHYYIETLYSHYAHVHDASQLDITRQVISEQYPEYLSAFDKVMKRTWGYMFNMMILQEDLMDDYCSWLFKILFEVYNRVDKTNMTDFDKRFCGRISERLFDVWLQNKVDIGQILKREIMELRYVEDVNWLFKVKTFLLAKFLHKKYGVSS